MYQLTNSTSIVRTTDGASIPPDPANRDWAAYEAWLALGNTPDPIAAPPAPGKPQQITPTQFLNRIPPAVLPVLWSSPQTGIMLITLAAAQMIDLTDPSVAAGINGLVPGILTADQAAAILDH